MLPRQAQWQAQSHESSGQAGPWTHCRTHPPMGALRKINYYIYMQSQSETKENVNQD